MIETIKYLLHKRWVFRSIFASIYFNFHYLPIKQAWHLPILFYKPFFPHLNGQVKIVSDKIKMGMIEMGRLHNVLYPNNGCVFENKGGTVVFKGTCCLGNGSALSIGPKGYIEFGDDFFSTTQFRCTSYHHIEFGNHCLFGWDCLVMDTDFHKLTKIDGGCTKGYGTIKIGSNNWIGSRCFILKNTETSDYCIISGGTKLTGKFTNKSRVIIGSANVCSVLKDGLWRNLDDDVIEYNYQ